MNSQKSAACPSWLRLLAIVVSITLVGNVIPAQVFAQVGPTKVQLGKAERLAKEARAQYTAGRYDDAASNFLEAYTLSKKSALLFNAARAKQMAGKYADARELFRVYKTLPQVQADGIKDADEKIAECDREIAKAESARVPPPPIVKGDDPSIPPIVAPTAEATKTTADPGHTPTIAVPTAGFTFEPKKLVSWQSGAAVLFVGTGIGLMLHAAARTSDANAMHVASVADKAVYNDTFSSARIEWGVGIASCIVGAGATYWAVTRAVTFGESNPKPAASVQIVPNIGGLTLVGRF